MTSATRSREFGLRGAPEVPFTPYKTFQTTIAAIEKLTQLTFTGTKDAAGLSLSAFDPLTKHKERPLLGSHATRQSPGEEPVVALSQLNQIILES